jgi:two-component sensor histidine kinase
MPGNEESPSGAAEIKRLEDELAKALDANAALVKELQQRVIDNLQLVLSLVRLQKAAILESNAREAFLAIEGRLRALSISNKLYSSQHGRDSFDLNSFLRDLSVELLDLYDYHPLGAGITLSGDSIWVPIDSLVPLGMISSEIIAGTLGAERPGAGRLRLDIAWREKRGGGVELRFCDDGGSFPENVIDGSRKPLGMMIVRTLAEQIGATVSNSNGERGAVTLIDFGPVSQE